MTAPNVAADQGERADFEDAMRLQGFENLSTWVAVSGAGRTYKDRSVQTCWEIWQACAARRPAAQGQALTDDQIEDAWRGSREIPPENFELRSFAKEQRARFARAIEARITGNTTGEKS